MDMTKEHLLCHSRHIPGNVPYAATRHCNGRDREVSACVKVIMSPSWAVVLT